MGDRRDGIERRDDVNDPITLGEVYRLLLAVDERTLQMQKDADGESHQLRNKLNDQAIKLALLDQQLQTVRNKQADWRNWVASVVMGVVVIAFEWLIQHGGAH